MNSKNSIILNKFNNLLRGDFLPLYLRIATFAGLFILICLGFSAYSDDQSFLVQLRNFNLGNLLVWSYWWPLVVICAVLFGRLWCFVCPVELITSFFAKIGLKKNRPKWLLSGWAISIFYMLILFAGIQVLKVHRNPTYMAVYLLTIIAVSVFTGLIYKKNTFCRYVCPVGYLLGLYSRISSFGWRVADKDICVTCKDKSCVHANHRYNLVNKSCGVDLYPGKLEQNDYCILCAGCLKTCDQYKPEEAKDRPNPGFRFIGFAKDLLAIHPLKGAETFFVLLVSGFVISEVLSEWKVTDGFLNYIPDTVLSMLPWQNAVLPGLIYGLIIFLLLPSILWFAPFLLLRIAGLKVSFSYFARHFALAFLPVMAAAHLSKGILKMTSRLPFFEHTITDVSGMRTTQQFFDNTLTLTANPAWLNIAVSLLIILFLVAGIILSFRVTHRIINRHFEKADAGRAAYLIPVSYGGLFLVTILLWRL
jgi:hypothetical protein